MTARGAGPSAIDPAAFRIAPGAAIDLARLPTRIPAPFRTKAEHEAAMEAGREELSRLQRRLYAHDRYALLLVFQGMDTAGKDGAIRHVMSGVNPQGCQVHSFAHPSARELDHDFLWRAHLALPERGRIGIFNRSHYEEVLIARVRPEILEAQKLPAGARRDGDVWEGRFRSIRDMEAHLHRNGTRIAKVFLHISREEQRRRLLDRIDDPEKNWKIHESDLAQRADWDRYAEAYEACLPATSTDDAPWYAVPADDKRTARLIVLRIAVETLAALDLSLPPLDEGRRRALADMRRRLEAEG